MRTPIFTRPGFRARRHTGVTCRAFLTLKSTACACCGRRLPPGTLITLHGTRRNRSPHIGCWQCFPFDLVKERSA